MSAPSDPATLHAQMRQRCHEEAWAEAATLARLLPAGDLNGYPFHDLWWQFAEALGDRVLSVEPELARRLYELAEQSWVKEASMASGPGEAYRVQPDIDRLRRKLARR